MDRDDVGVAELGEELALGPCRGQRGRVVRVEDALEDHPAVVDVAVDGEVDPAEATVRERAAHLVLAGDQRSLRQRRGERVRRAVLRAEAAQQAGPPLPAAADGVRRAAVAAVAVALGDLGVAQQGAGRVDPRHRRDVVGAAAAQRGGSARAGGQRSAPSPATAPGAGRVHGRQDGRRSVLRTCRQDGGRGVPHGHGPGVGGTPCRGLATGAVGAPCRCGGPAAAVGGPSGAGRGRGSAVAAVGGADRPHVSQKPSASSAPAQSSQAHGVPTAVPVAPGCAAPVMPASPPPRSPVPGRRPAPGSAQAGRSAARRAGRRSAW